MRDTEKNMQNWLYVGNLEPTVDEERLQELFGTESTPKTIIMNKREKRTSYAFVEFASQEEGNLLLSHSYWALFRFSKVLHGKVQLHSVKRSSTANNGATGRFQFTTQWHRKCGR